MKNNKKISVALAAYNGSKFIIEQLDSIVNQSIIPDEIIVCDDCSTDDTFKVVEKYAESHPIVKIYENDNNLGFIKNFEKAAKLCSGDFILFSDQDDIWTYIISRYFIIILQKRILFVQMLNICHLKESLPGKK